MGENVTILNNATIQSTAVIRNLGVGVEIGDDSAVGAYNFLSGQGGISIGKHVIMGPYVKIFSENHRFSDIDIPIKYQGEQRAGVVINDNCWIGAGSIILAGVHLPKGTVVGAGSVVTKSVDKENMILAGSPAKIIKSRLS
jgi:acetyltransferase-like isoleucine patch superfamily enzyme